MSDENNNNNVTFTEAQTTAITKLVAEAIKPIATEITGFKDTLGEVKLMLSDKSKSDDTEDGATAAVTGNDTAKKPATALDSAAAKPLTMDDVKKILAERDQESANSAAQNQANKEWLSKNAPKVAANPLLNRLIKDCKTDDERKSALGEWTESVTATGAQLPDLTTPTSESEGGKKPDTANDIEAQEQKQIERINNAKTFKL